MLSTFFSLELYSNLFDYAIYIHSYLTSPFSSSVTVFILSQNSSFFSTFSSLLGAYAIIIFLNKSCFSLCSNVPTSILSDMQLNSLIVLSILLLTIHATPLSRLRPLLNISQHIHFSFYNFRCFSF